MTPPTVAQFKAKFTREFNYGSLPEQVTDADITRAIDEVKPVWNDSLWDSDERIGVYCYAAAHFLYMNLRGAGGLGNANVSGGMNNGAGGPVNSQSVGAVTVSYTVSQLAAENPAFAGFLESGFGRRFLNYLYPRLPGSMFVVSSIPTQ